MKYIIVDFETNGRPCDSVIPKGGYPTQVSVEGFDPLTGEVTHLYDSFVKWRCHFPSGFKTTPQ